MTAVDQLALDFRKIETSDPDLLGELDARLRATATAVALELAHGNSSDVALAAIAANVAAAQRVVDQVAARRAA